MKAIIDYKLIQDNENALDISYKGIFHIDESNSKFKSLTILLKISTENLDANIASSS